MKKLVLLIAIAIVSVSAYCQKGYNDFDTVGNVLVKTKIAHTNSKDANSPLELSLFFQNIGTKEVVVCYELFIESGMKEKRHSGHKEVKVKPNQKQAGKISNLAYELIGTNISDYETGENQWYFGTLEVKDAETGEVIESSKKIREEGE